jgi:hypothetical protein
MSGQDDTGAVSSVSGLAAFVASDPDIRRCQICRELFAWPKQHRRHYADQRYPAPRRCPECRADGLYWPSKVSRLPVMYGTR